MTRLRSFQGRVRVPVLSGGVWDPPLRSWRPGNIAIASILIGRSDGGIDQEALPTGHGGSLFDVSQVLPYEAVAISCAGETGYFVTLDVPGDAANGDLLLMVAGDAASAVRLAEEARHAIDCWRNPEVHPRLLMNSATMTASGGYIYTPVSVGDAAALIRDFRWESTIGYSITAEAIGSIAGVHVPVFRRYSSIEPGGIALVARVARENGRMRWNYEEKGNMDLAYVLEHISFGLMRRVF